VLTNPVMVLSKRKNRRLKAEKAMQQNGEGECKLTRVFVAVSPANLRACL